jgi:hypothetical protein
LRLTRDQEAIKRKIEGLAGYYGYYGSGRNLAAAREFNENLVEKGDQEAIERKIIGLIDGKYGYEKNPVAAREFRDCCELTDCKDLGIKKGDF